MPCLLAVDEPLEPGGRVRLGRGAVEDEAVADPVVAQPAADHGPSVQQLCKMIEIYPFIWSFDPSSSGG